MQGLRTIRYRAVLALSIVAAAVGATKATGRAEDYLAVDFVPFATDRTEHLTVTGEKVIAVTFFRNKQQVVECTELEMKSDALDELSGNLAEATLDKPSKADSELGSDQLIVFSSRNGGRTAAIPAALVPPKLSELLKTVRSDGSRCKVASGWIRSVPFSPVAGDAPKALREGDIALAAWEQIASAIKLPLRFLPLSDSHYQALLAGVLQGRYVIVVDGKNYFEIRLYQKAE